MLNLISTNKIKSHALDFDALKGWCVNFYTHRTQVSRTRFSFTDLRNKGEEQRKKNEAKRRRRRRKKEKKKRKKKKRPMAKLNPLREVTCKTKSAPLFSSLPTKPNPSTKKKKNLSSSSSSSSSSSTSSSSLCFPNQMCNIWYFFFFFFFSMFSKSNV